MDLAAAYRPISGRQLTRIHERFRARLSNEAEVRRGSLARAAAAGRIGH
jgi:hypothetical protein